MTSRPHADLVADLFRHEYGRMVAGLVRVFGADRIDLAEDVVQEALLRALRTWLVDGVPERPDAWVFKVARNLALDAMRRRKLATRVEVELVQWAESKPPATQPIEPEEGIADDTLRNLTRHIETTGNPRIGQRDYGLVAYADPGYLVLPLASFSRSLIDLPGLGSLQLDPSSIVVGPPLTTGVARNAFLPMAIPNTPGLAGVRIYWQGLHVETNASTVHLTDGVVDTVRRTATCGRELSELGRGQVSPRRVVRRLARARILITA